MDIKTTVTERIPPKFKARLAAFLLALLIAFASARAASTLKLNAEDDTPTVDSEGVSNEGKEESPVQKDILDSSSAIEIGSIIGGSGAMLYSPIFGTVCAQRNLHGTADARDSTVFMVALTVARAVENGKINLSDEAVCPASAAKKPSYELSKEVLPIGKRMKVGDILRCMIYQSGSSYAYTLAVHISGSEEAFVTEMNERAREIGVKDGVFHSCCGEEGDGSKLSVYDLGLILKAFTASTLLRSIICSDEMLTVGNGYNESVSLAVKNDFFETYCTKSQAQADGIIGGKVGKRWSCIIFNLNGKEYISIILDGYEPFSDGLMLYSAYAPTE